MSFGIKSKYICIQFEFFVKIKKKHQFGSVQMTKHLTKFQNYSLELLPLGSQDTSCASPADIYLLQVNNRNTRTRCEICSKLTIKTPKRCHWRHSGVFIVNFEHISHLALVFLLLTLNM